MAGRNVVWHPGEVEPGRAAGVTGGPATVWFTGLSGSGKSTVAVGGRAAAGRRRAGRPYLLDGDNLRHGLNADLGFSAADRAENVRRVGEVAAPVRRRRRGRARAADQPVPGRPRRGPGPAHEAAGLPFVEVFVDTPLEVCEQRDPKGLYAKARAGEITGLHRHRRPLRGADGPGPGAAPEDGDARARPASCWTCCRPCRCRLTGAGTRTGRLRSGRSAPRQAVFAWPGGAGLHRRSWCPTTRRGARRPARSSRRGSARRGPSAPST